MLKPFSKTLSQTRGDMTILLAAVIAAVMVGSAYFASLGPVRAQRQLDQFKKKESINAANLSALEVTKSLLAAGAVNTTSWHLQSGASPNLFIGNIYCGGGSSPTPQSWENTVVPTCGNTRSSLWDDPFGLKPLLASFGSLFLHEWSLLSQMAWAGPNIHSESSSHSNSNSNSHSNSESNSRENRDVLDPFPGYEAKAPTLLINLPVPDSGGSGTSFVQFGAASGSTVDVAVTTIVPSGGQWSQGTLLARVAQPSVSPSPSPTTWNNDTCVFRVSEKVVHRGVTYLYPGEGFCPANYAIVTTGNGGAFGFVCCQLSADDVLTGAKTERNGNCNANELIVGSSYSDDGSAKVTCQMINTTKYKLGTETTSCVWGNGVGGRAGAAACGSLPILTGGKKLDGTMKVVGGDGCTGNPFGSFAVQRTSKQCGNQAYAPLLRLDNSPVPILYP